MKTFAVRLFKKQYQPLSVAGHVSLQHGDFVLVRTDRGEEVAQAEYVNEKVAKLWKEKHVEAIPLIKVLNKN